MIVESFDYKKKDGKDSHRKVMILNNHKEYIDTIDLDKLNDDEMKIVQDAQTEYEEKLAPFLKKSFRRFNKSGMSSIVQKENILTEQV